MIDQKIEKKHRIRSLKIMIAIPRWRKKMERRGRKRKKGRRQKKTKKMVNIRVVLFMKASLVLKLRRQKK